MMNRVSASCVIVFKLLVSLRFSTRVAALFKTDGSLINLFDIPQLLVMRISLPRPQIQRTFADTDMKGRDIRRASGKVRVQHL